MTSQPQRRNTRPELLLRALRHPADILQWPARDLDLVIRQARNTALLPRLATLMTDHDVVTDLPPWARMHFQSARTVATAHRRALDWELDCISRALRGSGAPVILLKGAAYAALNLPNAVGRVFGDVDLLVAREALEETEMLLQLHGWSTTHHDSYDQRYYREWMHELPPLQHNRRLSLIDLHHTIVPPTCRWKVDTTALLRHARPIPERAPFHTLQPTDLVIHSATHLMMEGEFDKALRDLLDIQVLLQHFEETEPGFCDAVSQRAESIGLGKPVGYVFLLLRQLLDAVIPESSLNSLSHHSSRVHSHRMCRLFTDALLAHIPGYYNRRRYISAKALYVRSHYLRMPWRLLFPHLIQKSFRQEATDAAP